MWKVYLAVVLSLFAGIVIGAECVGIFEPPLESGFLSDPNNQIRLHETLRVGQKLNVSFTVCDPDGDPVIMTPHMISPDCDYTIQGDVLSLYYHAQGVSKRDIVAFTLTDAPLDPNVVSESRIAAVVIDVVKNRAPVWK